MCPKKAWVCDLTFHEKPHFDITQVTMKVGSSFDVLYFNVSINFNINLAALVILQVYEVFINSLIKQTCLVLKILKILASIHLVWEYMYYKFIA